MKLEKFKEIFKDLDVDLISLQKGHGSEQLRNCSFGERFLKCQEEINNTWSFSDTAAIVLNCDLIITIILPWPIYLPHLAKKHGYF